MTVPSARRRKLNNRGEVIDPRLSYIQKEVDSSFRITDFSYPNLNKSLDKECKKVLTNINASSIFTTMKQARTIKIWKDTLTKLRIIHALTGESMVSILDCLISEELKKIRNHSGESGLLDTLNAWE